MLSGARQVRSEIGSVSPVNAGSSFQPTVSCGFAFQEEYSNVLQTSGAMLVLALGAMHGGDQAFAAAKKAEIAYASAVLVHAHGKSCCK